MSEFLEVTADKFTFRVATDRFYTSGGVWVQPREHNRIRVGITDFVQQHSGDAAFVTVKPVGTQLAVGDAFAEMETMKAMVNLPSPVAGTIAEVNPALGETPEIVNQDPYDRGWLAVIEVANWEADKATLLNPESYFAAMKEQVEEELK